MDSAQLLKKLFLIGLFPALNITAQTSNSNYDGPYVGSGLYFGLGAQYASGDVDYNSTTNFILGLLGTESETANISATGYSGIALLGFGFPFVNHFYLGAEVQGALTDQEGNLTVNSFFHDGPQILGFKARIKYLNNFGFFIRPGYYIDPSFLLFLRGGYINGGFDVAAVPGELNSNVPSLAAATQQERAGGFLGGAGIEMHLIRGLSARAEYDFINYSSINTNSRITFLIPGTTAELVTATTTNKFSPTAGVVTLALTYSFGYCPKI